MAPRPSQQRRAQAQSEQIFELGKQGRKTGVTLRESTIRDEHGMEPLDVFSSPTKTNGGSDESDSGEMDMEIENTSGLGPAALLNAIGNRLPLPIPRSRSPIKTHMQSPARRSQLFGANSSPIRPSPSHLPPPEAGSDEGSSPQQKTQVARKLNFGAGARAVSQPLLGSAKGSSRLGKQPVLVADDEDEEEEEAEYDDDDLVMLDGRAWGRDGGADQDAEESMALVDAQDDEFVDYSGGNDHDGDGDMNDVSAEVIQDLINDLSNEDGDEDNAQEEEAEEEEEPPVARAGRKKAANAKGNKPKARPVEPEEPAEEEEEETAEEEVEEEEPPVKTKKRVRPRKEAAEDAADGEARPKKRKSLRDSLQEETPPESETEPSANGRLKKGRGRLAASKNAGAPEPEVEAGPASRPKAAVKRGRKPRTSAVAADAETSAITVPRGPPLPKSRGLVINRKEVPGDAASMTRTRSGRNSFKPLAFWRNEHVELDRAEEMEDAFSGRKQHQRMWLPSIKEVVRVDEPVTAPTARPKRKASTASSKKAQKKRAGGDDEDEYWDDDGAAEPWEDDPGTISGDAVLWHADHEWNPPALDEEVEMRQERLAIAAGALDMRPIKDADFRFAKTLSEPFFGAGVVDLAPGAVKRPKNARRMYMAFFVFRGRVLVSVNDTTFRISQGGSWFVPRGNYYSIENDYDKPARIYFAQGCEASQPRPGGEEETPQ